VRPAAIAAMPAGQEVEMRLFLLDFAISSRLHLQVLDVFAKAAEEAVGRSDMQLATGGPRAQVVDILDQYVQARLVRRTRSPRIRGGTGFVFSPSPAIRNSVMRLLQMWRDPGGRAKLGSWLEEQ